MTQAFDRDALRELLAGRDPHAITRAADDRRRALHELRTTVAIVQPFDPSGSHVICPLTGIPAARLARTLEDVSDLVTDLVVLPAVGATHEQVRALWNELPAPPEDEGEALVPTVQLGTTDAWIDTGLDEDLAAWRAQGVRVISDGIDPKHHPARGVESAARWASFWHAAANAGLRGHATVLYGPEFDLESVFTQIDAIAQVQAETGVFLSVSPCVIGSGPAAEGDDLTVQASFELRVLAACRLGLDVEHMTLRFARGDLKSAHTSLLCGIDDLVGPLFLEPRDRKADAEAEDLSVVEMRAWLEEAGFEAHARNGAFVAEPYAALLGESAT